MRIKLSSVLLAISFVAHLLIFTSHTSAQVDTDGDGLLDLIDVTGFDPSASGRASFYSRGIQDLDGASLLTNLQQLHLEGNLITSIESGDFDGLTNLQSLDVSETTLSMIESGAFEDLTNLQKLNLRSNSLMSIANGTFIGLSGLKTLDLSFNEITSIEVGDFLGLTNLLKLNLGSCRGDLGGNSITSIERGAFDGLSNLQSICLGQNRIPRIERGTFNGLTHLQELDLFSNQITTIESGAFDGVTNLHHLRLHHNQLTSIKSGDLEGLTNLTELDLHSNQITRIESGAFEGLTNLQELELDYNQITTLNLSRATFENLTLCDDDNRNGFCIDSDEVTSGIFDDATLSYGSFDAIIGETTSIGNVSLVGLTFSDEKPSDLTKLLGIATLDYIIVDETLFDSYATEFQNFSAMDGNTVTVIGLGDANADGLFNSSDLINVFSSSKYETGERAVWSEGDFDGDHDFDSGDLIAAWAGGAYNISTRGAAVPEPTSSMLLATGLLILAGEMRPSRKVVELPFDL